MNRFLLGVLFGALLGAALGFVAFSGGSSREQRPVLAAPSGGHAQPEVRAPSSALADSPKGESKRKIAVEQRVEPTISKARLESALAETNVPEPQAVLGTLEIVGQVLDTDGNGIPEARVRASTRGSFASGRAADSLGKGAPDLSFEASMQSAADRFARSRDQRREAVTDASGEYRLEGLLDQPYTVTAYKPDYLIQRQSGSGWAYGGTTIDFKALPVVSVAVRVLMPDGTEASEAVISCSEEGERRKRLGSFAWSPEKPELRLPACELKLGALAGVFSNARSAERKSAAFSSETRDVEIPAAGLAEPLVFQLEGSLGIRGRVTDAGRSGVGNVYVYLTPVGDRDEVDLIQLAESDQRERASIGSEYSFMNLTAGRYAVGLARSWGGRIEDHRIVTIGAQIVTCDLKLPEPDLDELLVIEVLTSDGEALSGVDFEFRHRSKRGSSSSHVRPTKKGAGLYHLDIPNDARTRYYGSEETSDEFFLVAEHDDYGTKSVALTFGQKEVQFVFTTPAQLVITILGYAKSDVFGRAFLELTPISRTGEALESTGHMRAEEPDQSGVKDFGNLEPGRYRLTFSAAPADEDGWSRTTLSTTDLNLRKGPNTAQVSIPVLYTLPIDIAGGAEAQVFLVKLDDEGEQTRDGYSWGHCDGQGHYDFKDLSPGDYMLTASLDEKRETVTVSIPSGGLQLDSATW